MVVLMVVEVDIETIGYKLSYQVIKEDVKNFVSKSSKSIDISFAIFY